MSESAQTVPERASAADWLAVIAGTLGCLMALLDTSIVNSSLPTIQGEIGATPSEGTWVGTSFLVAEIVMVPLTAWLHRLMGLRRLLMIGAAVFTLFSVICGMATSLEMMIFGRIGQGFAGGVLIPTALTIVALRLPPKQQPVGLAIVASASLLGPITGPVVGGWLTENLSWHFAFFMNVPVCLVQGILVAIAMKKEAGDPRELRNADWVGVAGMVIGLGALATLLEEGHREQWFESTLIWQLAVASTIGFGLIAIGQITAARPVIRLALLRNRSLASAIVLLTVLGTLLYGNLFMAPQFLAMIAGYNAFQAGQVVFVSGVIAVASAGFYPLLAANLDMRVIVAGAVLCIALGAFIASDLTSQTAGSHFIVTQLMFGMGTTLTAIPLQQAVNASVSLEDAPEANSLSAVGRNFGGSLALAVIASVQDQRRDFHHWTLNASIEANDAEVQKHITDAADLFGGGPEGLEAAFRVFNGEVVIQAIVMTFSDMFLALSILGVVVVPLVLLLRKPAPGSPLAAGH